LAAQLANPDGKLSRAAERMNHSVSYVCRKFRPIVVARVLFHLEHGWKPLGSQQASE
jgi:hypothetical protein